MEWGMEPSLAATLVIAAQAVWAKPPAEPLKGRVAHRALVQMTSIVVVFLLAVYLVTPVTGQPAGYA
jgi:hypothetical protein